MCGSQLTRVACAHAKADFLALEFGAPIAVMDRSAHGGGADKRRSRRVRGRVGPAGVRRVSMGHT